MAPSDFTPAVHRIPDWDERFPWLFAGITGSGTPADRFNFAPRSGAERSDPNEVWTTLLAAVHFAGALLSPQAHGWRIAVHGGPVRGIRTDLAPADGHLTQQPGVLLAVTVADCVPVYLVDPDHRAIALLHAGWRGVGGGILAHGIELLCTHVGATPGRLHLHLGPSICGRCYEVGPEVFAELGQDVPDSPAPIDVRAVLKGQAAASGLSDENVSVSEECTLCGSDGFFSHRGGDAERQVALLGIRE